jgi:hypothetical protein
LFDSCCAGAFKDGREVLSLCGDWFDDSAVGPKDDRRASMGRELSFGGARSRGLLFIEMLSFGRAFPFGAGRSRGCDELGRFEGDDKASVVNNVDSCFRLFVLFLSFVLSLFGFFLSVVVVSSNNSAGHLT